MLAMELEAQRTALGCSQRSWRMARATLAKERILRHTLRSQRGSVYWVLHDDALPKREKTRACRFLGELRAEIAGTEPPPPPRIPSKYRYGSKKYRLALYSQPSLDRAEIAREIAAQEAAQASQVTSECNWFELPRYPGCEAALDDGFGHCRRCQVATHLHERLWSPQWEAEVARRNEAQRRQQFQDVYDTIGRSDGPGALGFNVSNRDD